MNVLKDYDIELSKLELGQHDFHYQIEDKFFELFDYSLIDHGSLLAEITLDKKTSYISLEFSIKGTIELICDRSLDSFDYDLETEREIVLKFGEEARELSDEIEMIPFNTQLINIGKYLYEFISVSIPMKKLHPRYKDESAEDQVIFSSKEDEEEMLDIDPRWSELKKLKNKE
ncbi:MAG: DUF177 domain-containing protein [Cyclobacteriaceae bacterium]|nr:DUF177 domain-containing protein [Cyclobacteriaceae bacterium]